MWEGGESSGWSIMNGMTLCKTALGARVLRRDESVNTPMKAPE